MMIYEYRLIGVKERLDRLHRGIAASTMLSMKAPPRTFPKTWVHNLPKVFFTTSLRRLGRRG
jgi:hypothetical protein